MVEVKLDTSSTQSPTLTIIIPTFNRSQALRSTVVDLLRQSYAHFDLWIIDQSDPEHAQLNVSLVATASDPRLHYLHLTKVGLPNARNEGLRRARGEIIVFVDDDVILLSPHFLAAHAAAFENPRVGGVTGRHVERSIETNCRHTACYVSWSGRTILNLFGTKRQQIGSCKGSNMSFRATSIAEVGGFDRNANLLEDTDFSVRVAKAGWQLLFEPDAELVHLSIRAGGVRRSTPIETEYERFRSTAYFVFKHRGIFGIIPFAATFALIAISRAYRFRSIEVLPGCLRAALKGMALAARGPDQHIAQIDDTECGGSARVGESPTPAQSSWLRE